jgi:two-component system, NarL family, sensor histidine kinase UhpB
MSMQSQSVDFNILIIEDQPADFYLIEQMLLSSKLKIKNIYSADRISVAIELLKEHAINLVLLDLSLPDSLGINSFLEIKDVAQKIPVIILTGLMDSEVALEALKQNAQDYLIKGEFNVNLLVKSIEYSIERKKAEEKILSSEEKYRQMFYKNPFPMWINEPETLQILEVNDAAIQKYGYERNEFLNLTLRDIQQSAIASPVIKIADSEKNNLWRHQKKNGEIILVEFTYYPIDFFGRTAMQAQINDVTEKIMLANELALKKRQIVEAVLIAQEKERKLIGEELHENINQILGAVRLTLSVALEFPIKRTELITNSMTNISLAIEEIRKLSKTLILTGNLKAFGLVQSIEELIKHNLAITNLSISLNAKDLQESSLCEEQKITLYRIIQEQLTNIIKHAQASAVTINLETMHELVTLLIVDNGKGFDPNTHREGIGITNIISRAQAFNGEVQIDSSPGNGCRLKAELKIKALLPKEAA